ncbi:MAG: hypothetical protein M4D80_35280 [Myxococcota bacterium]|nr:hypothetical protein [Deltaproteobacteria bacterium]MDQ3340451.1 hypothetical protein [Myxococcota bacterium]
MRASWLFVCLGLAACDDAVVLEVHTAPGVDADEVQLFIGLGECDDCPGIQPPNIPEILPGKVFYREDSFGATRLRTAKVKDGVARFRIEASEVGDAFTLAVAVDNTNRSAAVIQSLPLNEAGKYRVDLREANTSANGLGPKSSLVSGNFVDIWTQPGGTFPCMGFEHWSEGRLGDRLFIVPANDLDCDARLNMECAPYGYEATGLPTFEEATCTKTQSTVSTGQVCWLGGPACNEKSGEQHACFPTDYCLPSSYCDGLVNPACATASGSVDVEACLFGDAPPSARLKCTIAFEAAEDNTHATICNNDPTFEFDLFPFAPANSPLACVPPSDSNKLLYEEMGDPRAFTDKVVLTTKDATGKLFPMDFKLRYIYSGCKFKAELYGDKALGSVSAEKTVFAQFWTARNGGRTRKLLVPVELNFVEDCQRPTTCVLIVDESTTNCLR